MWRELAQRLETALYPQLQGLSAKQRSAARSRAAQEPFDLIEWAGLALGIVAVTALTRYHSAGLGMADRLSFLLLNFVVALPLLGILVGPFLIRRTRRGLSRNKNAQPD